KIKAVIALIFLGFVVAAAMRPSVEWLHRAARIPRGLGVLLHYALLLGLLALLLWLIVPRAISQIEQAVGNVPTSTAELKHQAHHAHGFRRDVLVAIQHRLQRLPSVGGFIDPLVSATRTAFEVLIGIFFMFAVGAYWIFERDRTIELVQSLVPNR